MYLNSRTPRAILASQVHHGKKRGNHINHPIVHISHSFDALPNLHVPRCQGNRPRHKKLKVIDGWWSSMYITWAPGQAPEILWGRLAQHVGPSQVCHKNEEYREVVLIVVLHAAGNLHSSECTRPLGSVLRTSESSTYKHPHNPSFLSPSIDWKCRYCRWFVFIFP